MYLVPIYFITVVYLFLFFFFVSLLKEHVDHQGFFPLTNQSYFNPLRYVFLESLIYLKTYLTRFKFQRLHFQPLETDKQQTA